MGEITILPGHVPLVAELKAGEIHAKSKTDDFFMFVSGGFVEIQPESKVIVLADAAEHHFEIDTQRAEEAASRARKEMQERKLSGGTYAEVTAALEKSLARLNVARKHAHRKSPATLKDDANNEI